MDFIKKNSFALTIGGLIAAFVGMFLDFVKVKAFGLTDAVEYIDTDDGKIFLVLIIVAFVFALVEKYKDKIATQAQFVKNIPAGIYKFVPIITSVCAFVLAIYDFIDAKDKLGGYVKVSMGIGLIIIIIGLVVTVGTIIVDKFLKQPQQ